MLIAWNWARRLSLPHVYTASTPANDDRRLNTHLFGSAFQVQERCALDSPTTDGVLKIIILLWTNLVHGKQCSISLLVLKIIPISHKTGLLSLYPRHRFYMLTHCQANPHCCLYTLTIYCKRRQRLTLKWISLWVMLMYRQWRRPRKRMPVFSLIFPWP